MKTRQKFLTSSMAAGLLVISMSTPTFAESTPCAPKAQPHQGNKKSLYD